jgi:hypothetical protein
MRFRYVPTITGLALFLQQDVFDRWTEYLFSGLSDWPWAKSASSSATAWWLSSYPNSAIPFAGNLYPSSPLVFTIRPNLPNNCSARAIFAVGNRLVLSPTKTHRDSRVVTHRNYVCTPADGCIHDSVRYAIARFTIVSSSCHRP